MKVSRYNFFYDNGEEGAIAYNSCTNALAILEREVYSLFSEFNMERFDKLPENIKEGLIEGGYVVDDEINELDILRYRLMAARYSTQNLGLTIAPTIECNFRCIYCFEKGHNQKGKMTPEVQQGLIDFVSSKMKNIDSLQIGWYGGEPLLAIDVIETLSEKFIKECQKNNVKYEARIITNGFLLSEKNAQILSKCKVSSCQITLDGCKEEHDKKRYLSDGTGTFDKIISNLKESAKYFSQIYVRVNIDRNNMDAIYNIVKIIKDNNLSNVFVYPAPIKNKGNCYDASFCMQNKEFFEYENSFISSLSEEEYASRILTKYPQLRGNICCADCESAYVVSPNGDLCKCWSDIGDPTLVCGNLLEKKIDIGRSIRYIKYDATLDEKCSKCKFLPICMGGCPYDVANGNNDRCIYFEDSIEELIKSVYTIKDKDND